MKVNTSDDSSFNFEFLKDLVRENPWLAILIPFYLIIVINVVSNPYSFSLANLDIEFVQVGFSLLAFILLVLIGNILYRQGFQHSWSSIFIIYSFAFLGLFLEALSFPIADMSIPFLFLTEDQA